MDTVIKSKKDFAFLFVKRAKSNIFFLVFSKHSIIPVGIAVAVAYGYGGYSCDLRKKYRRHHKKIIKEFRDFFNENYYAD